jgi:hypothetical protein
MSYTPYATYLDYVDFGGEGEQSEIEKQLSEASLQIDKACYGRVKGLGFENLTEWQQEMVKRAVCSQVDFIVEYGDFIDSPIAGYSAGSTSVSFKAGSLQNGIVVSNKAKICLTNAGLISRRLT